MSDLMICPRHNKCSGEDKQRNRNSICTKHDRCEPHKKVDSCDSYNGGSTINCPPCIPYVREFKIGDKVRVLGRTTDCCDSRWTFTLEGLNIHKGFISNIISEIDCNCGEKIYNIMIPDRSAYSFHSKDLELIKEDDKMDENKIKYKSTPKRRTFKTVYNENIATSDCKDLFRHFADMLVFIRPTNLTDTVAFDKMISWAEKDSKRVVWLIENGYIEKIEPEIFYKRGDRFMEQQSDTEHMLTTIGDYKMMLVTNDGRHWKEGATVNNTRKVTQNELNKIGRTGRWEKI